MKKLYKLLVHKEKYAPQSDDELRLNSKEFPTLKDGDVIDICLSGEDKRFLLQVKASSLITDQMKDSVSISQSVNSAFKLPHQFTQVYVTTVCTKDVALDFMELTYKEQYVSRADMWKLRKRLVNSCVYLHKKIVFCETSNTDNSALAPGSLLRLQVNELWTKGEQVTCGVVTVDTRVVVRSLTAQVNIFIQMSSEMWMSDNYGDLYFEKAVGGFLESLFAKWKEKDCNHDVTITMFSRTFYEAKSIDEFPVAMRECVQVDCLGRFYEDFYRVVVQNERYDDWRDTVIKLKRFFLSYQDTVLHYHDQPGLTVPQATNSTAADGNVLEVLNMSLNVFEKFYLDRCFDRTGKLSIVITPGQGVFNVDRDLTNITKQRTIDCGNSSDLVCMGEQPLHACPLFRFYKKTLSVNQDDVQDYNIPHWINHSFYTSASQQERIDRGCFVPRIILPEVLLTERRHLKKEKQDVPSSAPQSSLVPLKSFTKPASVCNDRYPFIDYDEHDRNVFKHNIRNHTLNSKINRQHQDTNSIVRRAKSTTAKVQQVSESHRPSLPRSRTTSSRRLSDISSIRGAIGVIANHQQSSTASSVGRQSLAQSVDSIDPLDDYIANSFSACSTNFAPLASPPDSRSPFSSAAGLGKLLSRSLETLHPGALPTGVASDNSFLKREYTPRALINPFDPNALHFKVTSNRRRWAHAFPTDQQGMSHQPHHNKEDTEQDHQDRTSKQQVFPRRKPYYARVSECSNDDYHRTRSSGSTHDADMLDPHTMLVGHGHGSSAALVGGAAPHIGPGGGPPYTLGGPAPVPVGLHNLGLPPTTLKHNPSSEVSLSTVGSCSSIASMVHDSGRLVGAGLGHSPTHTHRDPQLIPLTGEVGHAWLWGVTGEQEWTPEVTTGMDWKSMTIPASLPLTTDYIPDALSLDYDYVTSNYTLLPDMYTVDKPGSTSVKMIYYQLISQRIAQGFQVVVRHRMSNKPPSAATQQHTAAGTVTGQTPLQHTTGNTLSIVDTSGTAGAGGMPSNAPIQLGSSPMMSSSLLTRRITKKQKKEEHTLSIGRLFHKLCMEGDVITVTTYRPRHPYPIKSHHYTYRFQVPDSPRYDVSWSNFSTEQLENTRWNRVDLNICTRGRDQDFALHETEKFWRASFVLLPSSNASTKRILDGESRCDIYEDRSDQEKDALIEGFVKFLEIINKLKRPMQRTTNTKTSTTSGVGGARKSSHVGVPTPTGTPQISPVPGSTQGAASGGVEGKPKAARAISLLDLTLPEGTEQPHDTANHGSITSSVSIRGALVGPTSAVGPTDTPDSAADTPQGFPHALGLMHAPTQGPPSLSATPTPGSGFVEGTDPSAPQPLTVNSPLHDICEAMHSSKGGLSFLQKASHGSPLPPHTFIATDAVSWVIEHLSDVTTKQQAIKLLQLLLTEGYIMHGSRDIQHEFLYGFYLYIINTKKLHATTQQNDPLDDWYNSLFYRDWCEVCVCIEDTECGGSAQSDHQDLPTISSQPQLSHADEVGLRKERSKSFGGFMSKSGQEKRGINGSSEKSSNTDLSGEGENMDGKAKSENNSRRSSKDEASQDRSHDTAVPDVPSPTAASRAGGRRWGHVPHFLCDHLPVMKTHIPAHTYTLQTASCASSPGSSHTKIVNVELDPTSPSIQSEWASASYHAYYHPNTGFSLELQWLVAKGYVLAALVSGWGRKAASCGFHFLPIPKDPFALPFSPNSDPLRGPIFVPLNIECLLQDDKELFEAFPVHTREERLVRFQDLILRKFGFMLEYCDPKMPGSFHFSSESRPQYVHCTGGMCVLIPDNYTTSPRNPDGTHRNTNFCSYFDYIAHQRQLTDMNHGSESNHRIGFLWAWNYMLTKRWRSAHTGDEYFQDKMLKDFRAFCSNQDNRLVILWNECWDVKMQRSKQSKERVP